jgi:hypothetical protein
MPHDPWILLIGLSFSSEFPPWLLEAEIWDDENNSAPTIGMWRFRLDNVSARLMFAYLRTVLFRLPRMQGNRVAFRWIFYFSFRDAGCGYGFAIHTFASLLTLNRLILSILEPRMFASVVACSKGNNWVLVILFPLGQPNSASHSYCWRETVDLWCLAGCMYRKTGWSPRTQIPICFTICTSFVWLYGSRKKARNGTVRSVVTPQAHSYYAFLVVVLYSFRP